MHVVLLAFSLALIDDQLETIVLMVLAVSDLGVEMASHVAFIRLSVLPFELDFFVTPFQREKKRLWLWVGALVFDCVHALVARVVSVVDGQRSSRAFRMAFALATRFVRIRIDVLSWDAFWMLHDMVEVPLLLDEGGVALPLRGRLLVAGVVVFLPVLRGWNHLQNLLVFVDAAPCCAFSFVPLLVAVLFLGVDVD